MNLADLPLTARWWRFDRYEIRNGHIVPAADAQLEEYDFFEDHLRPIREAQRKTKSRAEEPGPHEDLANLNTADDAAILDWVHNWGLLGILPHTLEHVVFDSGATMLKEYQTWRRHTQHVGPDEQWPMLKGGGWALSSNLDNGTKYTQGAHETLHPFFPGLDSQAEYPVPLTRHFWRVYAEPVEVFKAVANRVRAVMLGFQQRSLITAESLRSGEYMDAFGHWYPAHRWLSSNAVFTPGLPDWPPVAGDPGAAALQARTLLAVIASMMWIDLVDGRAVRLCARPACGRVFATGLSARLYCGDKCKKAEEMRRWRKRSPESGTQG